MKFFKCNKCGNMVAVLHDSGVPMICCGEPMELLEAGVVDAAVEKHVPDVTVNGANVHVQIGSVIHPMLAEHYIEWICVETDKGFQIKYLAAGQDPIADFALTASEKLVTVYEFCNLHGLWKKDM